MKATETYFINFKEGDKEHRFVLSTGTFDNEVQGSYNLLSDDEKTIFQDFKADSRKNEFIAGRILAKNVISLITDLETNQINITTGVWGYPLVQTKGINSMWVSIAHSKRVAGALIAKESTHPIGLDVEEIMDENEDVLKIFLARYDQELSLEEQHLYWSAKEAVSKALRTGFTIPETIFQVKEVTSTDGFYHVTFKHVSRLKVLAWITDDVVTSIAYPTELKFKSLIKQ